MDVTISTEDCVYYTMNEGTDYKSGYRYDVTAANINSVRSNSQILEDFRNSYSIEIDSADVSFDFSFGAGYEGYLSSPSIYSVLITGTLNCRYNHLTNEVEFISFKIDYNEQVYSMTQRSTGTFYFKPWIGNVPTIISGIFSRIKIYEYETLN